MCGSSKSPKAAPPPPPPPPPPPKMESPEEDTGSNVSTTKASKTARSKLRIDLGPMATSGPAGSSGLGIPTS
jgi:hypothetical protein